MTSAPQVRQDLRAIRPGDCKPKIEDGDTGAERARRSRACCAGGTACHGAAGDGAAARAPALRLGADLIGVLPPPRGAGRRIAAGFAQLVRRADLAARVRSELRVVDFRRTRTVRRRKRIHRAPPGGRARPGWSCRRGSGRVDPCLCGELSDGLGEDRLVMVHHAPSNSSGPSAEAVRIVLRLGDRVVAFSVSPARCG